MIGSNDYKIIEMCKTIKNCFDISGNSNGNSAKNYK